MATVNDQLPPGADPALLDEEVSDPRRRDFLNIAAVTFAGAGAVAMVLPLVNQMNPSADVLAELALRSDLTRVLIVAHSAQRWVLRGLLGGEDLADVLTGPDPWQPGREYVLSAGWTREPE